MSDFPFASRELCAFAMRFHQFRDLLSIKPQLGETQFLFKCLLQTKDVAVLAKDQRNYQPVIACSHLAVGPNVSHKPALLPARYVRRIPTKLLRFLVIGRGLMMQ